MAKVEIQLYGVLAEVAKLNTLQLADINDTNQLIALLSTKYPDFSKYNYSIALNNKLITDNTNLNNNDKIAIMPPFSGG